VVKSTDGLPAVYGTMFVCGQNAYSYLPLDCRGSCIVAFVVPALKVDATIRSKRNLVHQNFPVAAPTHFSAGNSES
jgi:hypothetical protein